MEFRIGDFVKLTTFDEYNNLNGFIVDKKDNYFEIDVEKKRDSYWIHIDDAKNKMVLIS